MKILSWNCWGLGNPRTVQDLYLLVKEKRRDIVFLMETKLLVWKFEVIKKKLNCEGCFVVEPRGRSGGLALLWSQEVKLGILNFSRHHVSASLMLEEKRTGWVLTGFYGHPEANKRKNTWNLLSLLKPSTRTSWCVVGDFNKIVAQSEKMGGKPRPKRLMEDFRRCLEGNELT